MSTNGSLKGEVKWYNPIKGYGFILRPGEGDLFIHARDVHASGYDVVKSGQQVTFEIAPDRDGRMRAINIKVQ